MRNTCWGQNFARSLNIYCGHGAGFDLMGPLNWPNDVCDWIGNLHWPNYVCISQDRRFLIAPSLALRWGWWLELIAPRFFFLNIATNVLSACFAVAIFASAVVWYCYISVNNVALACAYFTLVAYPSVFKVLEDLRFSLNDLANWALK